MPVRYKKTKLMKTLNYLLTLAVILTATRISISQDLKIPVQNTKDGKLTLINFIGDLPVEGYSGNEIVITGEADHDAKQSERAKGLTPIYAAGTDNTGIGLHMEKNGNQVTVQCLLPITNGGEYRIKVPDNFSLKIESGCERNNDLKISNVKNEIDIKNCMSINLKSVSGPLVLSTISGDIDVIFSEINKDNPFSISDISGDIDITLPSTFPANLKMKTVTGNIYTDFDYSSAEKNLKQIGGSSIEFPLNGGGVEISLINISGNIYLRKGK